LPANDGQISTIAASLRDGLSVHAFAILKESFGNRYLYAGLGTTLLLGPKVTVKAEAGQPNREAMDAEDLRSYREVLMRGPMQALLGGPRAWQARTNSREPSAFDVKSRPRRRSARPTATPTPKSPS
jgi:hypothetical protein